MSTQIDQIVHSLKGYGVLTQDKINYILDKYSDEINRHGSTSIFKVKTITLNEEYLQDLNINFKYETREDFIPEEEMIDNSSNEDTIDVLEVNEDTVEEIDNINTPVTSLETNTNENDEGNFEWF